MDAPTSTVPTSCIQTASTVLPVPVDTVWKNFRALRFDALAPEFVTSTALVGPDGTTEDLDADAAPTVGAVIRMTYAVAAASSVAAVWEYRITELSDRNHTVAYDVLEADPPAPCTSMCGEISLQHVTDTDETFLNWTTVCSNDADAQVMQDQKYKKLDFFKAFKATLSKK